MKAKEIGFELIVNMSFQSNGSVNIPLQHKGV